MDDGHHILKLKRANFVPGHLKNSKSLKQNYRLISCLPILSKVMEKLTFKSLYEHVTFHEMLRTSQSGIPTGESKINQMTSIVHSIFAVFDCNPLLDVRSLYLDISKAFYRVWHDGLIYKLWQNDVSGQLLLQIQSSLADRMQRTVLYDKTSQWVTISAGVTQGSILGPLFFLVYINDLTTDLKCNVKLFADDTLFFQLLITHIRWAYDWRLSFNPGPPKPRSGSIILKTKIPIDHLPIGVLFDSRLKSSSHI